MVGRTEFNIDERFLPANRATSNVLRAHEYRFDDASGNSQQKFGMKSEGAC
jgi:6-phosphogluconolactonase/glucosamine-6-phosphate isomerase/deaminase